MKAAVIFPIPTRGANGYYWSWRSADGKTKARRRFAYYFDCVSDAQGNGYSVTLADADRAHAAGDQEVLPIVFRS
jgi:hypothetical protein